MDNNELKNKLEEVKNQIIVNSKDAHWAKNAISELLSIKGQLDHEPTIVYLPVKNIDSTMKADTFEIHQMKDGTAVYHVYGGYTVVVDPRMIALNEAIISHKNAADNIDSMTDEERENFALSLAAFGYVMCCPMFAFTDAAFTFDIAGSIVGFLKDKTDAMLNSPLREETREDIEANNAFKDSALAFEEFKEEVDKFTP